MCSSPDSPSREEVNVAEGVPALLRVFAALSSQGLKLVRSARVTHVGDAVWVYVPGADLAMEFPDAEPVLMQNIWMLCELGAVETESVGEDDENIEE